jgi:peptidoglycan/LPS O-acetylase OafA/YrhL
MGKHTASFRSDIEGLRAIAIVLVLLFHAGLAPRGGFVGVDVFFVISGYLITGLLSREAERSGQISLVQFYARRARRLLPAATLVLVTTTVFLQFFADTAERSIFAMDAVAASSYVANWRFMLRSVDYLAEDVQRSPFMHFWSLSVEEQFYFVWPGRSWSSSFLRSYGRFGIPRTQRRKHFLLLLPDFGN